MWIIFELLEGLVGFGKFRLAEMKSRPSAELDFSDSQTSDPNRKFNNAKKNWTKINHSDSSSIKVKPMTMFTMPEIARKWRQLQENARKRLEKC